MASPQERIAPPPPPPPPPGRRPGLRPSALSPPGSLNPPPCDPSRWGLLGFAVVGGWAACCLLPSLFAPSPPSLDSLPHLPPPALFRASIPPPAGTPEPPPICSGSANLSPTQTAVSTRTAVSGLRAGEAWDRCLRARAAWRGRAGKLHAPCRIVVFISDFLSLSLSPSLPSLPPSLSPPCRIVIFSSI